MHRAGSGLVDLVVALALLVGVTWGVGYLVQNASDAVGTAVGLVGFVLVAVAFPAAVETVTRGRTLGKLVFGLRAVRDDGGPITSRHAITRALVGFVEIYSMLGVPALVTSAVNGRSKRLGDLAAGTYVVSTRARLQLPRPPQMPPPLAAWASAADVTALPSGLTVAIRQFLARAATLSPEARVPMAVQLLRETMTHVAPEPPPGYHPEYVLAAVVAERRRRDSARLARDQALRDRLVAPDPLP
ncbi:RDD family protein [Phycicoccus sp. CMS6Z-2]|nr:RDD family protein [Phycicoccus flavus]